MELVCDSAYDYRCDECGGSVLISNGEYVCRSCGLVQGRAMVPEVRAVERCSPNKCGTTFYPHYDDPDCSKRFKLRKIHKYVTMRLSLSEWEAVQTFKKVCSRLRVSPQIKRHALHLFLQKSGETCWKPPLIAACLLHVSRLENNPIPLKTIVTIFGEYVGYKKTGFGKLFKKVMRQLFPGFQRIEPASYVPRVVDNLFSSSEAKEILAAKRVDADAYRLRLLNNAVSMLKGKKCNPRTMAAAAVYLADQQICGLFTQVLVADAGLTSHTSIRDNARKILGEK